jgi:hypothetical protein
VCIEILSTNQPKNGSGLRLIKLEKSRKDRLKALGNQLKEILPGLMGLQKISSTPFSCIL